MPAAKVPRGRVPAGMQYVILDASGRQRKVIGSGVATAMGVDCVQVKCPKAIVKAARGKTVRCWRCGNS